MANETINLNTPILTLDSDTVLETAQSKADLIWHDIQNAYRTRKICKLRSNGTPIPLLRNCYSIFNGTKYR